MKISFLAGVSAIFGILKASQAFQQSSFVHGRGHSQFSNYAVLPTSASGEIGQDLVWDSMRKDAQLEASREPLLASFMHATILSHSSLERALAFHIANLLSSPAMISTQIQALILEVIVILIDVVVKQLNTSSAIAAIHFQGFSLLATHYNFHSS